MRIVVRRTGGFAGITEELADVDTASVDASRRDMLEGIVRDTGFFDLPERMGDPQGADLFRYEVTVSDEGRVHTVIYPGNGTPPSELARLVEVAQAR